MEIVEEKIMKKIIVANWKMNGSQLFLENYLASLHAAFLATSNHIIICPPFPYLAALAKSLEGTSIELGAQNCHTATNGAFTGEVSASMLADIGCQAIIIGHSERRSLFNENDALIKEKATKVHEAGLKAILCIGESLETREAGSATNYVNKQLHASLPASATPENTYIAYEPIWAIGTGITASLDAISEMHLAIRQTTDNQFPLLYGGSVTELNINDILQIPNVDGVLVGGASLKPDTFQQIISS
jgi:triosephosphate isomerase